MEGKGDAGGLEVLRQVPKWATRTVLGMPPALFPPVSDTCSHQNSPVLQEEMGTHAQSPRANIITTVRSHPPPCLEFPVSMTCGPSLWAQDPSKQTPATQSLSEPGT